MNVFVLKYANSLLIERLPLPYKTYKESVFTTQKIPRFIDDINTNNY